MTTRIHVERPKLDYRGRPILNVKGEPTFHYPGVTVETDEDLQSAIQKAKQYDRRTVQGNASEETRQSATEKETKETSRKRRHGANQ